MDSKTREALEAAGINYEMGLDRFMGNELLYEKFLLKFLTDTSYQNFVDNMKNGDMAQAERSVHTLKGTAGNLSLDPLFNAADAMVKAIRSDASGEKQQELYAELNKVYEAVCDVIKQLEK